MSLPQLAWISEQNEGDKRSAFLTRTLVPKLSDRFDISVFSTVEDLECSSANFDLKFYQFEGEAHPVTLKKNTPVVALFHDYYLTDPQKTSFLEEASQTDVALFSSERNLDEFRRQSGHPDTHYLPFPAIRDESFSKTKAIERHFLGFSGGTNLESRAHKFLPALAALKEESELIWLLTDAELEEANLLLKEFSVNHFRLFTQRSPERWSELCQEIDIAVHVHFSAYSDPGPYLPISLINGLPSIVTDFGGTQFYPDSAVLKVGAGPREEQEIQTALETLISDNSSKKTKLSRDAQEYAREVFDTQAVAQDLEQVFLGCLS